MKKQISLRETEIIELIRQGYKYHEIAEILLISPHTVKIHMENIRGKLMAFNTAHILTQYDELYGEDYRKELVIKEIKRLQKLARRFEAEIIKKNMRVQELEEYIRLDEVD
jgi:DNA-binding CsgD family transcriptional regulator